jgi:hypothetical protein
MSNTPLVWGLVYCCVRLLSVAVGKEKGKNSKGSTVLCFCKIEQEKYRKRTDKGLTQIPPIFLGQVLQG